MSFKILFEDKNLLIAEKPQGMPCQKDPTGDADLYSLVCEHLKASSDKPVLNLINRLDRPVGGLVLFGKTSESTKKITKDLLSGNIKKDYLAVVNGVPKAEVVELADYIVKHKTKNMSLIANPEKSEAKLAKLSFKLIEKNEVEGLSLLNIRLKTGRHHQIRVQLSNYGLPIWGDTKYNSMRFEGEKWVNIALWAYKLSFNHPISRKVITVYSFPEYLYPWTAFENMKKD